MNEKFRTLALLAISLLLAVVGLLGVLADKGLIAWIGLLFFGCGAVAFTYRLLVEFGVVPERVSPPGRMPHKVSVSEAGVVSRHPNGSEERVAWDELDMVGLRAEDAYPVGGTYWILIGKDETGCVVPSEAEGCDELLAAMQNRLPGFDNEAVIGVMGMLEGGTVVWKRAGNS